MSSAIRTTHLAVDGLEAPAEILVDLWGIAHIYAGSPRDALFLQGYNAARDRLWQIDLWRKRGLGLLARDFGPDYVAQDRAARLFLYRGDMEAEWRAYGPDAKGYTEAFVAGVNAYVGEVRDGRRDLPMEFRLAGTEPDLWQPEDVVRIRSHGLTRNLTSEVKRAQVACAAGVEADLLRSRLTPEWTTSVPDGLDPCVVTPDILEDYALGTDTVEFEGPEKKAQRFDGERYLAEAGDRVETIGSNNWVIAGSRTATGRPILANDPHRSHGIPSLRYIVHLNAPGMSIIGAGEPALPGISIGHNGTIAFGLTIFAVDQEDLYVYELDPADPGRYRYGDGYEDITTVEETIEVKGGSPVRVELPFTRHGPVLKIDEEAGRAFAMRTVWLEPGTSAYFGSSDYMTARDWDGFLGAMDRFFTPSENQVFADTSGNIGWVPAAKTPRRTTYDGLLPVPGDGRYEWDGFMARSDLPSAYNPEKGWFATANQMNLPEGYPIDEKRVGFEWSDPSRYDRIAEVLAAGEKVTLADSMALQIDDVSPLDRRLVSLVQAMRLPDDAAPEVKAALALVQDWDGAVSVDSQAAVVGEIWLNRHLGKATVAHAVPEAARGIVGNGSAGAVLDLLENPDARLGSDPAAARDAILAESLASAVAQVTELLGDDPQDWRWGKLHQAVFEHALAPLADERTRPLMNAGPLAMGGSSSTPRAASYNTDFEITSGASFRMVLDVGNWDASRTINTPGQSGDPGSPHYRDLAPLWAEGAYVPLSYSREAVERAAAQRLWLEPGK
ncbi:penicillin acylase family protein [Marinivivus vitaminiproducens]|nr:penicillin acylase family protein [Geminicoccaceae bacterium SCSIO 64248]